MRLKIIQKISKDYKDNYLTFSASSTGPEINPVIPNYLTPIKHKLEKLAPNHITLPQHFLDEFDELVRKERSAVEARRALVLDVQEYIAPQIKKFLEDFPSLYPEELI